MSRVESALETLVAGLSRRPVVRTDWQPVIKLANHTLLTPALYTALAHTGQLEGLPQEVGEYLRFISDCNRERNQRLKEQLDEAVGALNRGGIVPVLLKGAVPLFMSPASLLPSRMTSDLDLSVDAAEEAAARACLAELGYVRAADRVLTRVHDAGPLEIRATLKSNLENSELAHRHGLQVRIPDARSRALHWILHDLLKEGDYWRGRIDLRHLHDLAQLAQTDGVDWAALRQSASDQTALNAIDTQLMTLNRFFGVEVPAECMHRPIVRFQHWRREFTATHSVVGAPLRLAGNLTWATRRLLQQGELVQRGPVDLARRAARTLFDRRSKI